MAAFDNQTILLVADVPQLAVKPSETCLCKFLLSGLSGSNSKARSFRLWIGFAGLAPVARKKFCAIPHMEFLKFSLISLLKAFCKLLCNTMKEGRIDGIEAEVN